MSWDELYDLLLSEPLGTVLILNYFTPDKLYYSEMFIKTGEDVWSFHDQGSRTASVYRNRTVADAVAHVDRHGVWSLS